MKRLLLAFFLCATLRAEPQELTIGDQGWSITIDVPLDEPLKKSSRSKGEFAFLGRNGRFGFSCFVEKPATAGRTHADAFEFYWRRAQQQQPIDARSIRITKGDRFHKVEFTTRRALGIVARTVYYYFAFQDRWVDIELSFVQPHSSDDATIRTFEEKLAYARKT